MKIVLLGPPGSGKGTQAKRICEKMNVPHISTGDILRSEVKNKTELGNRASQFMNEGKLVPDDLILDIVKKRLSEDDCKGGYLLDGFPRTLMQAQKMSEFADIDRVVDISVDDQEIIERIVNRLSCNQCGAVYNIKSMPPKVEGKCDKCQTDLYRRKDDTEDVISQRLSSYRELTAPLTEFYGQKSMLSTVRSGGQKQISDVTDEIMDILTQS